MCALLNVTVAALCISSAAVTRALSADVAGSVCLIVPMCTNNPEIWTKYNSFITTLYIGPYRAGLWVSIDSIMNRKQNNSKQEERNMA